MSVVNQMLKDLEDRNANDAEYSAVYKPVKGRKSSIWAIAFFALLIVLLGLLAWMLYDNYFAQQSESSGSMQTQTTTQVLASAVTNNDAVATQEPEPILDNVINQTVEPVINVAEVTEFVDSTDEPTQRENSELDSAIQSVGTVEKTVQTVAATMTVNKSNSVVSSTPETNDFSKQASGSQSTGVSLREQALAALRSGQDALGIQLLTQLIQLEPTNVRAYKKLSAVLYSQNQTIRAISVLEDGIGVSPQDADLRLMLARLLSQQNEEERALTIVTPEFVLSGQSSEFLSFRAALAEKLGAHNIAYSDYLQLSAEQPDESRWWLGLAVSSDRIARNQMAIEAYQRVIVLNQLSNEVKSFAQQRINQLARTQ